MSAPDWMAQLQGLHDRVMADLAVAPDLAALRDLKIRCLGKKGPIAALMKELRRIPEADRPAAGARLNEVRDALEAALEAAIARREAEAQTQHLARERIDVTLAGRGEARGKRHPVLQVADELIGLFAELGYVVASGPEIEDDWHNFGALNFPEDHPARDMQDTFFVEGPRPRVLRTHTSPVQIRVMEACAPPLRCLMPGRVYRCDSDITHAPVFHQIEGLHVDRGVSMADLKGTLDHFLKRLYGSGVRMRLRPSFFPFTEPSAEVDVSCVFCGGGGCRVCKNSGWIEVLGAGMVDPNVFRAVGYDPEAVSGFAFGLGVERVAMLRLGISDIRLLYENDVRFLSQF